jgi:ribose transport system ATP-binding protein
LTDAIDARDSEDRSPEAMVTIRDLSKSFAGVRVLSSVNMSLAPGEIRVLIGENGSGKSTLIKVLSGYHEPDPGGEVLIKGDPLTFGSPHSSFGLGCRFVHQNLGLVASSSVLDNVFFGLGFPTRFGTIRNSSAVKEARAILNRVGLNIDPLGKMSDLSAAERTGVAVARALREDPLHPPRMLVLDEPTAALPVDEVDRLLEVIRNAASNHVAVLFVTHHLEEVFRIAHTVTVIREGEITYTGPIESTNRVELIEKLIGKNVEEVHRRGEQVTTTSEIPALEVQSLWAGPLQGVSFSVAPGDVVGVAGLTGSGRETVLGAIFGAITSEEGQIKVRGEAVPMGRPDLSIRAGIGFLTADRSATGGIMALSALKNLTLPHLRPFWHRTHLKRELEHAEGELWFKRLGVRPEGAWREPLASFSGGNQQKVLFAKWLRGQPWVLMLDEPTQGVDVGARADLHRELLSAAEQGMAVIISSTDIEELTSLCDRVMVIRDGRISDELVGPQVESARLVHSIMKEIASQEKASSEH